MGKQVAHDLAIAYAQSKLAELQMSNREAIMQGNTNFSADEVEYLKSAYIFARKHLSE